MKISNPQIIKLDTEEAEALYATSINNECPYKCYYSGKRVWWAIIESSKSLPYTLCQDCYHNNRFGDKDISIKKNLKPIMICNIACNCDGVKLLDGFPITLNNGWRCALMTVSPKMTLIKNDYIYMDKKLLIEAEFPFLSCKWVLNFYFPNNNLEAVFGFLLLCEVTDSENQNILSSVLTVYPLQETGYVLSLLTPDTMNSHKFLYDKAFSRGINKLTFKIYKSEESKLTKNLILEFEIIFKHSEDQTNKDTLSISEEFKSVTI